MSGEDVRQRLAEALRGQRVVIDSRPVDQRGGPFGGGWCGPLDNTDELAAALLPVVTDLIAQARADEREKALRPLLGVCDAIDGEVTELVAQVHALPLDANLGRKYLTGRVTSLQIAADRVRRAAAAAGPTHEGEDERG